MFKKFLAILLAITLVLSGCGKKQEITTTKDGRTVIRLWHSMGEI